MKDTAQHYKQVGTLQIELAQQRAAQIVTYKDLPKKPNIRWDAKRGRFHVKYKGRQKLTMTPTGADKELAQMKVWHHQQKLREAQEELEQATINNQSKVREP